MKFTNVNEVTENIGTGAGTIFMVVFDGEESHSDFINHNFSKFLKIMEDRMARSLIINDSDCKYEIQNFVDLSELIYEIKIEPVIEALRKRETLKENEFPGKIGYSIEISKMIPIEVRPETDDLPYYMLNIAVIMERKNGTQIFQNNTLHHVSFV